MPLLPIKSGLWACTMEASEVLCFCFATKAQCVPTLTHIIFVWTLLFELSFWSKTSCLLLKRGWYETHVRGRPTLSCGLTFLVNVGFVLTLTSCSSIRCVLFSFFDCMTVSCFFFYKEYQNWNSNLGLPWHGKFYIACRVIWRYDVRFISEVLVYYWVSDSLN